MKGLHYFLVGIVLLAEIGVAALLVISVAPVVTGGLNIGFENDPEAKMSDDGTYLIIDGEAFVESEMPWDIILGYDIIFGTEEMQVASLLDNDIVVIERGTRTSLPFRMEAPAVSIAMFIMNTGISDDGKLNSTVAIPVIIEVRAEYIRSLVKFDLALTMEESAEISGDIVWGPGGSSLSIEIDFDDMPILSLMKGKHEIVINDGTSDIVKGSLEILTGQKDLQLSIGSTDGRNVADALREAYDGESMTIKVDGNTWDPYEHADDMKTLLSILEAMFSKEAG